METTYPYGKYFPDTYNNAKYTSLFTSLDVLDKNPDYRNPRLGKSIEITGNLFFEHTAWMMSMVQDFGVSNKGVSNVINAFSLIIPSAVIKYMSQLMRTTKTDAEIISFGRNTNATLNFQRARMLIQTIKPLVYDNKRLEQIAVAERNIEIAHTTFLLLVTPLTKSEKKEGCYIATMVYGNYDAPEVVKLRFFRDTVLQKSWMGRKFIKYYYSTSPLVILYLGNYSLFNKASKLIIEYIFKSMLK